MKSPMTDIPIIDLSGLRSPDIAARRAVAAELGAACRQVGFFYVRNHSIPDTVAEGIFAAAHSLFALPDSAKNELSIKRSPHNRGYVGVAGERLDTKASPDQKEAFNIGFDMPADDPEVLAGKPFRGVNLWPAISRLAGAGSRLLRRLHGAATRPFIAASRSISASRRISSPTRWTGRSPPSACCITRRVSRPKGPRSAPAQHTDYGNVTILATDGVAGLQVRRRDGVWLDAPHVDGAFVCNIGDCLMRWTNDVYVSTPHRVLRPKAERYSVAFFADANPDAMVETLPTCLAPGEAPRYPPITCADYLRERLTATYDHLKTAS